MPLKPAIQLPSKIGTLQYVVEVVSILYLDTSLVQRLRWRSSSAMLTSLSSRPRSWTSPRILGVFCPQKPGTRSLAIFITLILCCFRIFSGCFLVSCNVYCIYTLWLVCLVFFNGMIISLAHASLHETSSEIERSVSEHFIWRQDVAALLPVLELAWAVSSSVKLTHGWKTLLLMSASNPELPSNIRSLESLKSHSFCCQFT